VDEIYLVHIEMNRTATVYMVQFPFLSQYILAYILFSSPAYQVYSYCSQNILIPSQTIFL